ncbi:MAG: type II secretion system F family protein [Lachnospiraceae bacterium]|nr:type II secretion system F family protein [Lachnospiraceae bacterium]
MSNKQANNTPQPLNNFEISTFSSQMSMMLSAGITVSEALRLVEQDAQTDEGKELVSVIYNSVEKGSTLSQAMEESGVFPRYMLDMVHLGQETGKLDSVFSSLADYYDRNESINSGIRQAVTYPFIMIAMMLCVIIVLVSKVLPVFSDVYEQLGTTMTGVSATILNAGGALGAYSVIFISIFCLFVLGYVYVNESPKAKEFVSDLGAKFFLTRNLFDKIAAGHFASGMALAISSGFPTTDAINMVEQLINNKEYRKKITLCKALVGEGTSFADAAVKSNVFSGTYGRIIASGYKSGMLDQVMNKVAAKYEEEIDHEIGKFLSVIEPTLVAVLSLVVGLILLSVMLPLMSIISQIG